MQTSLWSLPAVFQRQYSVAIAVAGYQKQLLFYLMWSWGYTEKAYIYVRVYVYSWNNPPAIHLIITVVGNSFINNEWFIKKPSMIKT